MVGNNPSIFQGEGYDFIELREYMAGDDIRHIDWNMPEMNGLELVKKVRADSRFIDLPIIMVTTEGGKAEVITALKAGVNNYIVKPFTPQVLKEKLGAVMGVEV
jgi:two-component system chemotaxis response regulator CheY